MGCAAMQPPAPPRPSDQVVLQIMRATLAALSETDDGAAWCAQMLRKRGWSVVAPAKAMGGKG